MIASLLRRRRGVCASVLTAEELADEMSCGFHGAEEQLSLCCLQRLRGDVPRTGEEQESQLQVFTRLGVGTLGAARRGGSTKSPVSARPKKSLAKS